jgi:hypothetical protein
MDLSFRRRSTKKIGRELGAVLTPRVGIVPARVIDIRPSSLTVGGDAVLPEADARAISILYP